MKTPLGIGAAAIATFALAVGWPVAANCQEATNSPRHAERKSEAGSAIRHSRHGNWYIVETENFQACCEASDAVAGRLAEHAKKLRTELCNKWLGGQPEAWKPRCQIILYPNQQRYVAAVGRGSEGTVGWSLVDLKDGKVVGRRVDLKGGRGDYLSAALPHELTHVVLKDRFCGLQLPRWADEGIATLADPDAKQARHLNDLANALAGAATIRTAELVAMDDYPPPHRIGTFYGQSVSLTKYLVGKKDGRQFLDFIERATSDGYDAALQKCYGISSLAELDRAWRKSLGGDGRAAFAAR